MDLYHQLTPAILSYEGIAYQYMAPSVFENGPVCLCAGASAHPVCILRRGEADGRRDAVPPGDAGKGKDRRGQRICMITGETGCTGRFSMTAGSLSIWRQKNTPGVSRSICSRRMFTLPASLENSAARRSSRKACTRRWPEARWCGSWRRTGSDPRRK